MGAGASSRERRQTAGEVYRRELPMWVVRVSDLLALPPGPPPAHQVWRARNLLVEHLPSFFTIFVSHQWTGNSHPDPSGMQIRTLQEALASLISGDIKVKNLSIMQFLGRVLPSPTPAQLLKSYLWFDWFSVPQVAVADDDDKAETGRQAQLGIRSIPSYVISCQLFMALVPRLPKESGDYCSHGSWLRRGWCRTETFCNFLGASVSLPTVLIHGSDHLHFAMPSQWVHDLVPEGDFSVEADRMSCCDIVKTCLDFRISELERQQSLDRYRYLMARYRDFTGFETPAHSVTSFLSTFKFSSLATAASARKSLSGVACAVLSRNLTVLRALSEAKADLDAAVLPLNDFDLWPGFTAVHVACQGGPRFEAILRELLELRADPRGTLHGHAPALSLCTSPGAVEILVDHRADVNQLQPTFLATPVQLIAGRGVPPPVLEKLIQLRADVNLSRGGTGMPVLSWLASFTGTSYARETLSLLVDAAADVNARVKMTGIIRKIELGSRFYAMFAGKKDPSMMLEWFTEGSGCTPLAVATINGCDEMIELLLQARADPAVPNHTGKSPLQLARYSHVRRTWERALEVLERGCQVATSTAKPEPALQEDSNELESEASEILTEAC